MHCAKACQIKRTLFLVLAEKSKVRPENQTLLALTNVTVNDLGTRNRFVVCVKMKCMFLPVFLILDFLLLLVETIMDRICSIRNKRVKISPYHLNIF